MPNLKFGEPLRIEVSIRIDDSDGFATVREMGGYNRVISSCRLSPSSNINESVNDLARPIVDFITDEIDKAFGDRIKTWKFNAKLGG